MTFYEDFLCPACGNFERTFGPTVSKLIDIGAIAADYSMVAILDSARNQNYSSRAGAAALCVADENHGRVPPLPRRAVQHRHPTRAKRGKSFPDNARLIELAREAGAAGKVPDCINSGKYLSKVTGEAAAAKINATPTIKINGDNYDPSTPDALVNKIKEIVGNIPGIDGAVAPASRDRCGVDRSRRSTGDLTPDRLAAARVPALSAWWVLIAGLIGLVASMTLTVEKIDILLNPSYVPSCNINPILSCGSVMVTPQASLLGFPNPLLGLVAFTVVVVTGLLAVAKVALPQWYWVGLTVGAAGRRGVRALADLPEPVSHRRAVPVLHGGVGGHHLAAGRGRLDRAIARYAATASRSGVGAFPMAVVDRGALVHRGVLADHGAVLGLLVDAAVGICT